MRFEDVKVLTLLRFFWRLYHRIRRYTKVYIRSLLKPAFKYFDFKSDKNDLNVNIGAGQWWLRHWYNLDAPFGVRSYRKAFIDFPFDLCSFEKLPFENSSVQCFYSSHTIEHIPQKYLQHLFNECFRSMKTGGIIRITTPDFDKACDAYERRDKLFFTKICSRDGKTEYVYPWEKFSFEQSLLYYFAGSLGGKFSDEFLRDRYQKLGRYDFANEIIEKIDVDKLGAKTGEVGFHSNWFSHDKLRSMLELSGFKHVRKCKRSHSASKFMRTPNSYFDQSYPKISLYIEAEKITH